LKAKVFDVKLTADKFESSFVGVDTEKSSGAEASLFLFSSCEGVVVGNEFETTMALSLLAGDSFPHRFSTDLEKDSVLRSKRKKQSHNKKIE
jgi:hypothetical protein